MENLKVLNRWMAYHKVSAVQLAKGLKVTPDTIYRAMREESISKVLAWKLQMITGIPLIELLLPNLNELITDNQQLFTFKTTL